MQQRRHGGQERDDVGNTKAEEFYKQFRVTGWINDRSTTEDIPVITPSSEQRGGYGNNAYGKPSLSYLALKDMLGDELFKKALHTYMDNWHGKHPIPWDYFNSMNSGSGRNLNWFFNNWFFTNYYDDLALQNVQKQPAVINLTFKILADLLFHLMLKLTYADGSTESFHQTPGVGKESENNFC